MFDAQLYIIMHTLAELIQVKSKLCHEAVKIKSSKNDCVRQEELWGNIGSSAGAALCASSTGMLKFEMAKLTF